MSDESRIKLDTTIERELHSFVRAMSERIYDDLQLYCRKNAIPVEPDVLSHVLKTTQTAMMSYEMQNVDNFHTSIKKQLDDYVGEANPTESKPPTTKKAK